MSDTVGGRIRLLGPPAVEVEGQVLRHFRSHRSLALLAYLICEDRPHSRQRLAALLWPNHSTTEAQGNFRRTLHDLTQKLPGAVCVEDATIYFDREGWAIDLDEFAALRDSSTESQLLAALELARGEFLAGIEVSDSLEFDYWLTAQREIYRHQMITLLERLLSLYLDSERFSEALQKAWQLLSYEPWRERIHRIVMRLLVRTGHRNSALRQYELCRRHLREELAIEPSEETQRLYRRICRSLTVSPFRVPADSGPFVGRRKVLSDLLRDLATPDVRLITLSGPAGVGKTRLAQQLAVTVNSDSGFRFLDGICYLDMAAGCKAGDLLTPLWNGLGLAAPDVTPSMPALADFLHDREMLLILDNFTDLPTCRTVITELVAAAEDLVIVAISRGYLDLPYERHHKLVGLDAGGTDMDSTDGLRLLRLLRERAGAPALTAEETEIADSLSRLLKGNPLAIRTMSLWTGFMGYLPLWELLGRVEAFKSLGQQPSDEDWNSLLDLLNHCSERERHTLHELGLLPIPGLNERVDWLSDEIVALPEGAL